MLKYYLWSIDEQPNCCLPFYCPFLPDIALVISMHPSWRKLALSSVMVLTMHSICFQPDVGIAETWLTCSRLSSCVYPVPKTATWIALEIPVFASEIIYYKFCICWTLWKARYFLFLNPPAEGALPDSFVTSVCTYSCTPDRAMEEGLFWDENLANSGFPAKHSSIIKKKLCETDLCGCKIRGSMD